MAHILLADDDATTRSVLERALATDGHTVETAQDGSEAAERIAGQKVPDVLVTDIQMPGLDGLTLARNALARSAALKVLLMSGYPEQLAGAANLPKGRVATLAKPASIEAVRSAIRALLA